jgi:hypothetical protein
VTLQKYFSHPSCLTNIFPTQPIKLKQGLQICGRVLIATDLDHWNYLANQTQGVVSKYELSVFITPLQGSSGLRKEVHFFWSHQFSSGFTGFELMNLIEDFQCRIRALVETLNDPSMVVGTGYLVFRVTDCCWLTESKIPTCKVWKTVMEAVPMTPVLDSNRIALHHTIGHYN